MGRRAALPSNRHLLDDERGNEPCQTYRQDLTRHADATYVNLGTTFGSPAMEPLQVKPTDSGVTPPLQLPTIATPEVIQAQAQSKGKEANGYGGGVRRLDT